MFEENWKMEVVSRETNFKLKYRLLLSFCLIVDLCLFAQKNIDKVSDSLRLYEIAYIEISGNDKTRKRIVERELHFKVGEQYTHAELEDLIKESHKNLVKLSLFNYVTIDKQMLKFDRVGIMVILEERWFIWPQFTIINNDRNLNTWWKTRDLSRLDYRLAIEQNNVFGLNHTLKFELSYGYTRDFSLGYQNISLGEQQKHFIDWHVNYFKQNSIFYKSVNDKLEILRLENDDVISGISTLLTYSFRPRHRSTHSWSVSFNDVKIADTLQGIKKNFLSYNHLINKYLELIYNYTLDNRDDASFSLSGNKLQISVIKRGFALSKKYPVNLMYLYGNFKQFYKITNRLYGAHSLSLKKSLQSKTPYYYKRGLGYSDCLRGFEYYVVEAEDLCLIKNTLNFEVLPRIITNLNFVPIKKFKKIHYSIYLNTFFDIGYAREKDEEVISQNRLNNTLLYSGGLGINLVTYYDKVLRIEYSLNSLGERGFFVHFKASI